MGIVLWIVFGSICLAELLTQGFAAGVFDLKFLSFKNELFKDIEGRCCSDIANQSALDRCATDCSIYAKICVKQYQTVITNTSDCTFGQYVTSSLGKGTQIDLASMKSIQMAFSFEWKGDFTLIIEIFHASGANVQQIKKGNVDQLLLRVAEQKLLSVGTTFIKESYKNDYSTLLVEYRVMCEFDFYGPACTTSCKPKDDNFGHFVCDADGRKICIPGWHGDNCNKPKCLDGCHEVHGYCTSPNECRCKQGYKGAFCNECMPYPSCMHGTCSKPFECNCNDGWGGLFCNQDLNYCTTNKPCLNGGTCSNTGPTLYSCQCKTGFVGANCENRVETCSENTCFNGGTCKPVGYNVTCLCPKGFSGNRCLITTSSCFDGPCQNGGQCFDTKDGFSCLCLNGWHGNSCEIQSDICERSPCVNGGLCISYTTDFKCICPFGFSGRTCTIKDNFCSPNPCLNKGSCMPKVNNFQCICPTGFSGSICQDSTNECLLKSCTNGGVCVNDEHGQHCLCPSGFTGSDCTVATLCNENSCFNGGSCMGSERGIQCQCPTCWEGFDCSIRSVLCPIISARNDSTNLEINSVPSNVLSTVTLISLTVAALLFILLTSLLIALICRRRALGNFRSSDVEARRQNESNDKRSKLMQQFTDNRFVHLDDAEKMKVTSKKVFNNDVDCHQKHADIRNTNFLQIAHEKLYKKSDLVLDKLGQSPQHPVSYVFHQHEKCAKQLQIDSSNALKTFVKVDDLNDVLSMST